MLPLRRDLHLHVFNIADDIRLCGLEWFSSGLKVLISGESERREGISKGSSSN